jgi:hypothetical protein
MYVYVCHPDSSASASSLQSPSWSVSSADAPAAAPAAPGAALKADQEDSDSEQSLSERESTGCRIGGSGRRVSGPMESEKQSMQARVSSVSEMLQKHSHLRLPAPELASSSMLPASGEIPMDLDPPAGFTSKLAPAAAEGVSEASPARVAESSLTAGVSLSGTTQAPSSAPAKKKPSRPGMHDYPVGKQLYFMIQRNPQDIFDKERVPKFYCITYRGSLCPTFRNLQTDVDPGAIHPRYWSTAVWLGNDGRPAVGGTKFFHVLVCNDRLPVILKKPRQLEMWKSLPTEQRNEYLAMAVRHDNFLIQDGETRMFFLPQVYQQLKNQQAWERAKSSVAAAVPAEGFTEAPADGAAPASAAAAMFASRADALPAASAASAPSALANPSDLSGAVSLSDHSREERGGWRNLDNARTHHVKGHVQVLCDGIVCVRGHPTTYGAANFHEHSAVWTEHQARQLLLNRYQHEFDGFTNQVRCVEEDVCEMKLDAFDSEDPSQTVLISAGDLPRISLYQWGFKTIGTVRHAYTSTAGPPSPWLPNVVLDYGNSHQQLKFLNGDILNCTRQNMALSMPVALAATKASPSLRSDREIKKSTGIGKVCFHKGSEKPGCQYPKGRHVFNYLEGVEVRWHTDKVKDDGKEASRQRCEAKRQGMIAKAEERAKLAAGELFQAPAEASPRPSTAFDAGVKQHCDLCWCFRRSEKPDDFFHSKTERGARDEWHEWRVKRAEETRALEATAAASSAASSFSSSSSAGLSAAASAAVPTDATAEAVLEKKEKEMKKPEVVGNSASTAATPKAASTRSATSAQRLQSPAAAAADGIIPKQKAQKDQYNNSSDVDMSDTEQQRSKKPSGKPGKLSSQDSADDDSPSDNISSESKEGPESPKRKKKSSGKSSKSSEKRSKQHSSDDDSCSGSSSAESEDDDESEKRKRKKRQRKKAKKEAKAAKKSSRSILPGAVDE